MSGRGELGRAMLANRVDGGSAARCVALVERCAGKFLRAGGGALVVDQPQYAPHKRRGPKSKQQGGS